jgi:hypothetical protein
MATTYSIENLLEGKFYRSHSLARKGKSGIIYSAEKSDVWFGNDYQAYTICVRPQYEIGKFLHSEFYATIAVKVGE